ncbi:hypothetical protein HanXRQr2_Chr10g0457001 [Helianthus annuus]|uniref:Uncharacterized protein n=1 Tax=Helianthus annuus TaxID=4232 RepID=A0A9K3N5N4_HELAN|nr:hypothetical protein HanXRQr2_Chr10g0457001 [Helianthus annuus]
MGPRPNPNPPRVVTWAFLSNPRPKPHILMLQSSNKIHNLSNFQSMYTDSN